MKREIPAKRDDGLCSVCVDKKATTREGFCLGCLRRRLREVDPRWAPRPRTRGKDERQEMKSDVHKRSDLEYRPYQ